MIPQNNPYANYIKYKPEIDSAIQRVLSSGIYILGKEIETFEREFSNYIGSKYTVCVNSGTDALHLSLRAFNIGTGDEVITVSHTSVATIAAIEMAGALPVLVDIDPNYYTMDPNIIESAITKNTKAIIPVHLYGHPSDIKSILEITMKHRLFLIEDCAQAHGALYRGQRVGSLGNVGAFSFYPTKNLGCIGDGGAITTNDINIYKKLIALRQYGWDKMRISHLPGFNTRMDEIQAAILRVKLRYLDENNKRRNLLAQRYNNLLKDLNEISTPKISPFSTHVFHQYVIRLNDKKTRDKLILYLREKGIFSSVHYPVPVHLQPAYKNRLKIIYPLTITESVAETILSLPMYPELKKEDVEKIVSAIYDFFNKKL